MNLELDFRRHVYGGDVGQRIELGQQHSFNIHRRSTTCALRLRFCFVERSSFIPTVRLSRAELRVHVAGTKMR